MLTAAELSAMRTVQAQAMPETCTIQRSTRTANGIGEAVVTWSSVATGVACRLAPQPVSSTQTPLGDGRAVVVSWWLTVGLGVDVRSGDRVIHSSGTYEVINAFVGFAWETARRCELREVERG